MEATIRNLIANIINAFQFKKGKSKILNCFQRHSILFLPQQACLTRYTIAHRGKYICSRGDEFLGIISTGREHVTYTEKERPPCDQSNARMRKKRDESGEISWRQRRKEFEDNAIDFSFILRNSKKSRKGFVQENKINITAFPKDSLMDKVFLRINRVA